MRLGFGKSSGYKASKSKDGKSDTLRAQKSVENTRGHRRPQTSHGTV